MRITVINDDITGLPVTNATETKITIGDVSGTLDLSAESLAALTALATGNGATALAALLAPAPTKTTRTTRGKRTGESLPDPATGATADEMRVWAKANGYTVNERGRVPKSVKVKYAEAHRAVKPEASAPASTDASATPDANDASTTVAPASATGKTARK